MIGSNWTQKGFWANVFRPTRVTGLVSAGTNQATALALTSEVNMIATTALTGGIGVILPAIAGEGDEVFVYNGGANPSQVYGPVAGAPTINGIAGATGIPLATLKGALFIAVTPTAWVAIVSA